MPNIYFTRILPTPAPALTTFWTCLSGVNLYLYGTEVKSPT